MEKANENAGTASVISDAPLDNASGTPLDNASGTPLVETVQPVIEPDEPVIEPVIKGPNTGEKLFDICAVEAMRSGSNPKVTGLKIISVGHAVSMTDEAAKKNFNDFIINNYGRRAVPKGIANIGDILPA